MEIVILQNEMSLGDKYQIFIDEQDTHTASKAMLQLLPVIVLSAKTDARPRMTMMEKVSPFKAAYDIRRWDNIVLEFRTESFWNNAYQCDGGPVREGGNGPLTEPAPLYEIYRHRGRKYSIYKAGTQVAWWDKKAVTWGKGHTYKIIADNDCDFELLMSFCLILDNFSSRGSEQTTVSFDLGYFGPEVKKFDETWQPKT